MELAGEWTTHPHACIEKNKHCPAIVMEEVGARAVSSDSARIVSRSGGVLATKFLKQERKPDRRPNSAHDLSIRRMRAMFGPSPDSLRRHEARIDAVRQWLIAHKDMTMPLSGQPAVKRFGYLYMYLESLVRAAISALRLNFGHDVTWLVGKVFGVRIEYNVSDVAAALGYRCMVLPTKHLLKTESM